MPTRLFGLFFAAALLYAQDYSLGPDSQPQAGVPKGVITKHVLAPGRFYPGTPHNYSLYVPAQYSASKPAPVMIFLDGSGRLGNGERVPVVLDNLIAHGDLPSLIGIFIDPGVLPALGDTQSRFERVFEYDSLSDRCSRFLLEELIPEVAKNYQLSKDPNDRGLAGVSTGAVGAFAAAWNRPDQFRRVLSFIGTFVAMKGADSLPALIRRTEPKPIRVFLQAGHNDHIVPGQPYGTFYAGSWPVNNQVMYDAFQFAGYDAKLVLGEEGHNMKQGGSIMPEALRWLWRDYPKPIVVREPETIGKPGSDPRGRVYSTISGAKGWEPVGGSYGRVGGLAANRDGSVYFTDPAANRIYHSDADGKVTVFRENANGATALRVGADGRLYAALPGKKRIVSYGSTGDEKTVAADADVADFVVTAKGAVYFTDAAHKTVRIAGRAAPVRVEMASPSGVALSGDQAMVVVSDAQARFSWSFRIAADGSLENGEPFYRLEMPESGWSSQATSVAEDSIGQVYFATASGIQVCEANGRVAMILNPPEYGTVQTIAFGGKDLDWLYVAEGGKVFRRPVKVAGTAAWQMIKLPKPPL